MRKEIQEEKMKVFKNKNIIWDDEAGVLLKKVPFFVRRFAQAKVEAFVRSQGRSHICAKDVDRARWVFLKNIEQEESAKKEASLFNGFLIPHMSRLPLVLIRNFLGVLSQEKFLF